MGGWFMGVRGWVWTGLGVGLVRLRWCLGGVGWGAWVVFLGVSGSSGLFEVVDDGGGEGGERVGCYRPRVGVIGASGQRPCESPLRRHRP